MSTNAPSSVNLFQANLSATISNDEPQTQRCGVIFPSQTRELKTPNFVIGTARGSTPHLTPDMVLTLPQYNAMQISLGEVNALQPALVSYKEAMKTEKPYHDMLQLPKNHCVVMGLRNPTTDLFFYTGRYQSTPEQAEADAQFPYQLSAKVAATRSETGAVRVTPHEFLTKTASFSPDILLLGGQDSDITETKSRAEKTMRRNLEWIDQLYLELGKPTNPASNTTNTTTRIHRTQADLEQTSATSLSPLRPLLIAPLEGGSHLDKRTRNGGVISRKGTSAWQHMDPPQRQNYTSDDEFKAAEKVYQDKITNDGHTVDVIADGYHLGGLGSTQNTEERQKMIQASLKYLVKNDVQSNIPSRLRMATITGEPFEVVDLIKNGIDLVSVTYPQTLTEEGLAMTIPISTTQLQAAIDSTNMTDISDNDKLHNFNIMNLRDDRFVEDPLPIDPACTCYSCKHHSRGYINHLLNTHEMLAEVLLMLHNLHNYSLFFQNLRELIEIDLLNQKDQTIVSNNFDQWYALAKQIYVPHVNILHRNSRNRHYVHHDPNKV